MPRLHDRITSNKSWQPSLKGRDISKWLRSSYAITFPAPLPPPPPQPLLHCEGENTVYQTILLGTLLTLLMVETNWEKTHDMHATGKTQLNKLFGYY